MIRNLALSLALVTLTSGLSARAEDVVPIRSWTAPGFWQPSGPDPVHPGKRSALGVAVEGASSALPFIAMTPCRLVDTRSGAGPFAGPILAAGSSRSFDVPAGPCAGIPASAAAYSLNITVTASPGASPGSYLTAWATGSPTPNVSNLNYATGQTIANAAIVPAGTAGAISVVSNASTHLIIDINGYYAPPPDAVAAGAGINPLRVALLRWYSVNQARATFSLGEGAGGAGAVFDGVHVWVASPNLSTVTRLRACDGADGGTFAAGPGPNWLAFDGANIWVTNFSENTVTRLRASDGAINGVFPAGVNPGRVAFDGANIWITNFNDTVNTVTKLRASDGSTLGTYPVGTLPSAVAFDGANVWVTNYGSGTVTKLRASDGANLGSFAVGAAPSRIAFDGTHVRVMNVGGRSVTKLRATDGANLGTFPVGDAPADIVFDGSSIWVTDHAATTVTKLRASDGANLGAFDVGLATDAAVFDGANVWVVHGFDHKISKL